METEENEGFQIYETKKKSSIKNKKQLQKKVDLSKKYTNRNSNFIEIEFCKG